MKTKTNSRGFSLLLCKNSFCKLYYFIIRIQLYYNQLLFIYKKENQNHFFIYEQYLLIIIIFKLCSEQLYNTLLFLYIFIRFLYNSYEILCLKMTIMKKSFSLATILTDFAKTLSSTFYSRISFFLVF